MTSPSFLPGLPHADRIWTPFCGSSSGDIKVCAPFDCILCSTDRSTDLASGTKLPVTWIALAGERDRLVDDMYMPPNTEFKDPSRMSLLQGMPMLEFWRDREDKGLTPFEFHHYRTRDGSYHKAVTLASTIYSSGTKGKARQTKKVTTKPAPEVKGKKKVAPVQKKRQLRGRRTPEVSSEDREEESDKDSDEANDDDEDMDEELGEENMEEDFTDVLKAMVDMEESMDAGPSQAPGHVLKVPGTSPADVKTSSSRLQYLLSLCTRSFYQDMVNEIFAQQVKSSLRIFPASTNDSRY